MFAWERISRLRGRGRTRDRVVGDCASVRVATTSNARADFAPADWLGMCTGAADMIPCCSRQQLCRALIEGRQKMGGALGRGRRQVWGQRRMVGGGGQGGGGGLTSSVESFSSVGRPWCWVVVGCVLRGGGWGCGLGGRSGSAGVLFLRGSDGGAGGRARGRRREWRWGVVVCRAGCGSGGECAGGGGGVSGRGVGEGESNGGGVLLFLRRGARAVRQRVSWRLRGLAEWENIRWRAWWGGGGGGGLVVLGGGVGGAVRGGGGGWVGALGWFFCRVLFWRGCRGSIVTLVRCAAGGCTGRGGGVVEGGVAGAGTGSWMCGVGRPEEMFLGGVAR